MGWLNSNRYDVCKCLVGPWMPFLMYDSDQGTTPRFLKLIIYNKQPVLKPTFHSCFTVILNFSYFYRKRKYLTHGFQPEPPGTKGRENLHIAGHAACRARECETIKVSKLTLKCFKRIKIFFYLYFVKLNRWIYYAVNALLQMEVARTI